MGLLDQRSSGQWPTLMANIREKKIQQVDTLAITVMIVYLAQLKGLLGDCIDKALSFIKDRCYIHEIEGFRVWHFNAFYPPDWEDTSMAVCLLLKNRCVSLQELEPLRTLLIQNTPEMGTGVWVKDPYSKGNSKNNHWDPTTTLNVLRLHCLLETDRHTRMKLEKFVKNALNLENFSKMTLYYTPPLAAFFGKQLLCDFPMLSSSLGNTIDSFCHDVVSGVEAGKILASPFEKALLGIKDNLPKNDPGFIFHHGKRFNIWYGSPLLFQLALA